jgi:hypothetical protein
MKYLILMLAVGFSLSSTSSYAAKACYVGGKFQGFPCQDGGRLFTGKGQSTLLK